MADAAQAGRHDHSTLAEQAASAAALVKQHLANLEEVILQAQGQHSKAGKPAAGAGGGAAHHRRGRGRAGGGAGAPFRFLSVFKWETRKGWDILLRCAGRPGGRAGAGRWRRRRAGLLLEGGRHACVRWPQANTRSACLGESAFSSSPTFALMQGLL